jgi:hypothetical protein
MNNTIGDAKNDNKRLRIGSEVKKGSKGKKKASELQLRVKKLETKKNWVKTIIFRPVCAVLDK